MTDRTRIALLLALAAALVACTTNQYFVPLGSRGPAVRALADEARETVVIHFNANLCPDAVGVIDPDCPSGIGGDATACRQPGDGTKSRLKVVRWKKDDTAPPAAQFAIAFTGLDPCVNSAPNVCTIKNDRDLPWNGNDFLLAKYNVTSPGCDALDPYIIVTR